MHILLALCALFGFALSAASAYFCSLLVERLFFRLRAGQKPSIFYLTIPISIFVYCGCLIGVSPENTTVATVIACAALSGMAVFVITAVLLPVVALARWLQRFPAFGPKTNN